NEIVIGDFEELLIDEIEIINYKFHYEIANLIGKELTARPRFSSKGLKGKLLLKIEKNDELQKQRLYFKFEKKTHENSEGQHIVFYLDNELIGGGEIKKI
ncbi:MAG: tRNA 2-thiouridine(34) synthase MnmA, partial [Pseudoleptotrichia goodfellowii]|nr:tRNA 2-thiouridine(34) synthase MnmA [Pseudoleptotrichia goodfellowii]